MAIFCLDVLKRDLFRKSLSLFVCCCFVLNTVVSPVYAQVASQLPVPGVMVPASSAHVPVLLKGMTIHPENPFKFDFIVDNGQTGLSGIALEDESKRLVNYFLAAMTVPSSDFWVNLSPVEQDRIIPEGLSKTELGEGLLAQDYILKQVTATLMHPESALGKKFWGRVYAQAQEQFGTSDIPTDAFNKVWILPETATVFEKGASVFVVGAKFKVMLDSDYQAAAGRDEAAVATQEMAKEIMRAVILPEIEKEVNNGENFAQVRQIYYSLILAKWYKQKVRNSILSKIYIDQNKMAGIDLGDPQAKEAVYRRYMEAYEKGVYNYIKDEQDAVTGESIPRKYFSGGIVDNGDMKIGSTENAQIVTASVTGKLEKMVVDLRTRAKRTFYKTLLSSSLALQVVQSFMAPVVEVVFVKVLLTKATFVTATAAFLASCVKDMESEPVLEDVLENMWVIFDHMTNDYNDVVGNLPGPNFTFDWNYNGDPNLANNIRKCESYNDLLVMMESPYWAAQMIPLIMEEAKKDGGWGTSPQVSSVAAILILGDIEALKSEKLLADVKKDVLAFLESIMAYVPDYKRTFWKMHQDAARESFRKLGGIDTTPNTLVKVKDLFNRLAPSRTIWDGQAAPEYREMRKVDFKLLFTALTEFLDDEKNSNNIVGQELAIRLILERQSESYERQQVFDLLIAIIDRTKGSEAILPTASNGLELLIRRDNNLVLFGVGSDFVVNSLVGRPSEKVWRAIMSYMNGWDFRLLYALSLNPDIGAEIKAEVMKKLDAALDVALPTIRHKDESSYWRMRHWGVGVVPYCMTFAQRSKLTDSQRKEYKSYSADPDAFLFVLRTYALELIGWNADPNDKSVVEFLEGVIKDETGLYTAEHKAQAAASIKMLKERAVVKSGEMYSEKWIQAQVMDAWQKTEGVELKEAVKKLNLSISYEDALNEMNGNNVDEAEKPAIDRSEIKSTIQGGIDMNDIQISGADAQSGIQFDPAMMDRALNAKVDGFAAVVVSMTPVDNVLLLLK